MRQQQDGNNDGALGAGGRGADRKGDTATGNPHAEQEYHRGILARDRGHDAPLNRRAARLYRLATRGKIYLLQRRIAANEFTYFFRSRA
jgi:hypothetical protein